MKQAKQLSPDNIGKLTRVITDLNKSDTYTKGESRAKYIRPNGRIYSLKQKEFSKGVGGGNSYGFKLQGHSSRLLLKNVSSTTQEGARQTVLKTGNKSPHSFLDGDLYSYEINEEKHSAIVADMLEKGAKYLSYDPYKVKGFVLMDSPHLPADCSALIPFKSARLVYCFEDSVLALV